jgi:putative spermidine/putrescine transport system permease protein
MTLGFRAFILAIYLFIFAPLVVVVLVSFNSGTVASLPIEGFSLRWYARALQSASFTGALWTSFWLASLSTLIAAPLALAAAVVLASSNFRGRSLIESVLLAPLVVPGIVIGIALLLSSSLLQLRDVQLRLVIAHVMIAFPYCLRTVHASLARLDGTLLEAASTLGAGRWRAFRHVTLPLAMPGIAAGMTFGFLQSFGDVPISLFLTNARNNTLPLSIMSYLEYSVDPSVAAMSSLVTVGSLLLALGLERLVGLRRVVG